MSQKFAQTLKYKLRGLSQTPNTPLLCYRHPVSQRPATHRMRLFTFALLALSLIAAVWAAKDPLECEVCKKVVDDVKGKLGADDKKNLVKIEDTIGKHCAKVKNDKETKLVRRQKRARPSTWTRSQHHQAPVLTHLTSARSATSLTPSSAKSPRPLRTACPRTSSARG